MEITILGSGNGGCAVAFDHSIKGHNVRIFDFDKYPRNICEIQKNGGIYSEGFLEGFAQIKYAGHDIKKALEGAEIIYVVTPAHSIKTFAEVCKNYLQEGQIVIVCPGSCMGSIEFKNSAGLLLCDKRIIVSETHTLPYAVRTISPGRICIYHKLNSGIFLAALPSIKTTEVLYKIKYIYPGLIKAKNVIHTSLQNGNPVIHPAVTLLNTALIERTNGNFLFYQEGITPAVGRLIKAIDQERINIGNLLNLEIMPDPYLGCIQKYMTVSNYDTGYSDAPGFLGIKAQNNIDSRYINEDVGYGLVFWQSLAQQIGAPTPSILSVIHMASILLNRDYLSEGKRTMNSLNLSKYTLQDLNEIL
jgi:opine dehydrogenase